MLSIRFLPSAWADYMTWYERDRETFKRINRLIKDIQRTPYEGLGKPEGLKQNLSGWWSRRIDHVNRLVYRVEDGVIIISGCRTHYGE